MPCRARDRHAAFSTVTPCYLPKVQGTNDNLPGEGGRAMNDEVKAAEDAAMAQVGEVVLASGGIALTEGAARYSVRQAIKRVALAAFDAIDNRHECCTTGCGAIADDGYGHKSCPTCQLCDAAKRELKESMSKRGEG